MTARLPFAAKTLRVTSVITVLLAFAPKSVASEFPKEVCGVAELSTQNAPELSAPDFSATDVDGSYGIAFSGGGSRSAAATVGQLRGLHLAGIMPSVGYVSAVSGGAWAATPYTYHKGGEDGVKLFLGLDDYRVPGELSAEDLRVVKEGSFAEALDGMGLLVTRVPSAILRCKGNEIWSDVVGKELLKPFGLYRRESVFGWTEPAGVLDTTLIDAGTRHIPYLIIGGTVKCGRFGGKRRLPLEISPLYTGILPNNIAPNPRCPQSGYMQTYTFDNRPAPTNRCPGSRQSYRIEKKKDLFTLSDALGITSSAPGLFVGKLMPFQTATMKTSKGWDNFTVRDGGGTDNLGLLPLLARRVPNIILFVNSKHPIVPRCKGRGCKWRKAITSYFEYTGNKETDFIGQESTTYANDDIAAVFMGSGGHLIAHLARRKLEKKVPYYCGTFRTSQRNQLNLPSTYTPRVCWVYLDRTGDWIEGLHDNNDQLIGALNRRERPYRGFPHYSTFAAEGSRGQAADLDAREIIAIGQLTTWTVCEIAHDLVKSTNLDCPGHKMQLSKRVLD